jgi:sRNA-binding protein
MNAIKLIELLATRFPLAFSLHAYRRKPLKLGVHHDVLATLGDEVDPKELSAAMRFYTGAEGYLKAVRKTGARRVDLSGADAGEVAEGEREYAQRLFDARIEKRKKKAAAPAAAIVPAGKDPPTPAPAKKLVGPARFVARRLESGGTSEKGSSSTMTKSEMYDWVREQYRVATNGKYGNVDKKFYDDLIARLEAREDKFEWWWFNDAFEEIVACRQTAA